MDLCKQRILGLKIGAKNNLAVDVISGVAVKPENRC